MLCCPDSRVSIPSSPGSHSWSLPYTRKEMPSTRRQHNMMLVAVWCWTRQAPGDAGGVEAC